MILVNGEVIEHFLTTGRSKEVPPYFSSTKENVLSTKGCL